MCAYCCAIDPELQSRYTITLAAMCILYSLAYSQQQQFPYLAIFSNVYNKYTITYENMITAMWYRGYKLLLKAAPFYLFFPINIFQLFRHLYSTTPNKFIHALYFFLFIIHHIFILDIFFFFYIIYLHFFIDNCDS